MGNRYVMKFFDLLGRTALETYRASIGRSRFFVIYWFRDTKDIPVVTIEESDMA
ncbi:hypothetical Protein YC6258_03645 [Gynuella sunshinyii YC6258]|uniref:Uncharacterized protein n=1 Tax=Gynuella sunshinyii YC6258 TaxID=1445510 RepID=A0A0C5VN00_9GAMM|nr:hypothetical Protein YC6258_03645 [Gynuella sunshinyii YC6258]